MQGEKWTHLDFSRRTDALAARQRCDLNDLPQLLGFSRASLFNYRAGKATITPKAWSRLAQAETRAGIVPPLIAQLTAGENEEAENLRNLLETGEWGDNEEAQLAAMLRPEIIGKSVRTSWDLLEADVRLFVKNARKAEDPKKYLDAQVPLLKNQMRGFRFQLDRYMDHVSRALEETEAENKTPERNP